MQTPPFPQAGGPGLLAAASARGERGGTRRQPLRGWGPPCRFRQTRLDSHSPSATTAIPFTFLSLRFSSVKDRRGAPTGLK